MTRQVHVRHLRHRNIETRGLFRGSQARPRLRHLDNWIDRIANSETGGLANTESVNSISSIDAGQDHIVFGASHTYVVGERVHLVRTSPGSNPTPLVPAGHASATFDFIQQPLQNDTLTLDTITYTFKNESNVGNDAFEVAIGNTFADTISNLAAAIVRNSSGNTTASNGSITWGANNAVANNNVVIGSTTYTFVASGGNITNREINIGADITATLQALVGAINGAVGYPEDPNFTASLAGTIITLHPKRSGPSGNATVTSSVIGVTTADPSGGSVIFSHTTTAHPTMQVQTASPTQLIVEARVIGSAGDGLPVSENATGISTIVSMTSGGAGVDYFAIPINATTIQVATSEQNAHDNIPIDITAIGGGTLGITRTVDVDEIIDLLYGGIHSSTINSATDIDNL